MDEGKIDDNSQIDIAQESLFLRLVKSFNGETILSYLGMLQLIPENHGFNESLEEMVRLTHLYRTEPDERRFAAWPLLSEAVTDFNKHFKATEMVNAFTENAVFSEGNYIVYPGLFPSGTEILNQLLEVIFITKNKLPEGFIKLINSAVGLLLYISDGAAKIMEQTRYQRGDTGEKIIFPEYNAFISNIIAVKYTKDHLKKVAELFHYDLSVLEAFTVKIGEEAVTDDDPDQNIVLKKPLAETAKELIVCTPTTIVGAIIGFIYERSKSLGCYGLLVKLMGNEQFRRTSIALSHMGWPYTDIKLPENKTSLFLRESVWQIDNQKFGYLCFINSAEIGPLPEGIGLNDLMDDRIKTVTNYLNNIQADQQFPVLALLVWAEIGEESYFMWRGIDRPNLSIGLKFHELLTIALEQKSNVLTLWKFAKTYHDLAANNKIMAMGGTLDVYAVFANNHGSLLESNNPRPTGLVDFEVGIGDSLIEKVRQFRDEHAVKYFTNGLVGYIKVIRKRHYAPIYQFKEKQPFYGLMIECYRMPVWVCNEQVPVGDSWAHDICEAVIYWLYKMGDDLSGKLKDLSLIQFLIQIEVDSSLLKGGDFIVKSIDTDSVKIVVDIVPPKIFLKIPYDFLYVAGRADNLADQMLLKAALNGIVDYAAAAGHPINLSAAEIDDMIAKNLQPAQAKMILFGDSAANVWLDNRKLPHARYIQEPDTSRVLESLISYLPTGIKIPANIISNDGKIGLCDDIVHAIAEQLKAKIEEFDGNGLLSWLVKWNERCIFTREFREIQIPAKIACFSEFNEEVQEMLERDSELAPTSLALRTLIEFVAVKIPKGDKWPNYDDMDELLALTDQLLNWGSLSEAIRMGIDNPKIGLLPSGRIGTDKTVQREKMESFLQVKMTGEVHNYIERFEENYLPVYHEKAQANEESQALDSAFSSEFGIFLTHLSAICGMLINEGFVRNKNSLIMTEIEVFNLLSNSEYHLDEKTITIALGLLKLLERPGLLNPPDGYSEKEIFVWHYTRPLSYLRRPLIPVLNKAGEKSLMFGYRHIKAYFENLLYLLQTGKFPEKNAPEMKAWIGATLDAKGGPFRNSVRDWFKKNTSFEIIEYEVTMDKNGHIPADKNYGDIDLLIMDHQNHIVYSIECKNNVGAKNIHEMKGEMDLYLGREGQAKKAKIRKHVERHGWLSANPGSLTKFLPDPENYEIRSLIMTAEEMPLGYWAAEKVPLPILSFKTLKAKGSASLA
jgi:hypothetical protein